MSEELVVVVVVVVVVVRERRMRGSCRTGDMRCIDRSGNGPSNTTNYYRRVVMIVADALCDPHPPAITLP